MKNFYIIFFTFVFFTSNAFGYHCWFRPYAGDIRVADINGRQIYTLFTAHLGDETEAALESLTPVLTTNSTDLEHVTKYVAELHNTLSEHVDRINSEKSDFRQLSSLLNSRQIDWIGIEESEFSEEYIQAHLAYKESISMIEIHPLWSQQNTDDLLYLLSSVHLRIVAEYPYVLDRTKIVPLEDTNAYEKGGSLFNKLPTLFDRLRNSLADRISIIQAGSLRFLGGYIRDVMQNMLYGSEEVEELLLENLNLFEDNPHVSEVIRDFLHWIDELSINIDRRDDFVVEKILEQEGNGVILRGSAHQKNVESGLTQACLDSRSL